MTNTALAVVEPRHPVLQHPSFLDALQRVMDNRVNPNQFNEIVSSQLYATPELAECTKASLYSAICTAARDGLLPTGRDGGGWLLPRKVNVAKKGQKAKYEKRAVFSSSYVGELSRVRRVYLIKRLVVECVYDGDYFMYRPSDLDSPIDHRPEILTRKDKAEIIGAYAIVLLDGDQLYHAVMNNADIDRVRASSESYKNEKARPYSPWTRHKPEMCKKSVLRRVCKILPRDRADAVLEDEPVVVDVAPARVRSVTSEPERSEEDELAARLRGSLLGSEVVAEAADFDAEAEAAQAAFDAEDAKRDPAADTDGYPEPGADG